MKREFLKELGLEDAAIDKIMAEHGKGINSTKAELEKAAAERDRYKIDLEKANTTIEGFGDVEAIKADVDKYKAEAIEAAKKHELYVKEQEFNSQLNNGLAQFKPKNEKAVKALLDIEALKGSNNFNEDLKNMMDNVVKENAYLFDTENPDPTFTKPGGGNPPVNPALDSMREAMGLKVEK